MNYNIPSAVQQPDIISDCSEINMIITIFQIIIIVIAIIIFTISIRNYIKRIKIQKTQSMDKIKSDKFAKKRLTFGIIISIILSFISHFAGILKSFKPIIYLYPLKKGKISLKLKYPERLTCSYPKYENSWEFIADTAGKLIDTKTNKEFYALYWEGKFKSTYNKKEGFCIPGNKTAEFLEEKLKILGLNYKEANEFIMYWLPQLEKNKFNFIRFETSEFLNSDDYMPLEISPAPDTIIRILMEYKPLSKPIKVTEQIFTTPKRKGFVVVEWGGTKLNKVL